MNNELKEAMHKVTDDIWQTAQKYNVQLDRTNLDDCFLLGVEWHKNNYKPRKIQMENLKYICTHPDLIDKQNIQILQSLYDDLQRNFIMT